jgi:hypothetical protein
MRTHFRHVAVVVPLVLVVLLGSLPALGQLKVNTFDRAVADSMFAIVFNVTANATDPKPIHTISDDPTTKREGTASLKNVWRVHTTESWGGLNMLSMTLPTKNNGSYFARNYRARYGDSTYIDWDGATHLSLWYNTAKRSTAGDVVQMRFHIYEGGPGSKYYTTDSTNTEDWYFQSPLPLNDSVPGWHELLIPLVDTGTRNAPGAAGFCITDWSGAHNNDKLDLDRIIGYTIEWTAGKAANDTSSGIVFYDDLRLQGIGKKSGNEAFYRFNDFSKDTANFASGWNNGGLGGITIYEEKTDTLMGGPANVGWDWKINAKESWGGGANREYNLPAGTYMSDLSAKSQLQFYVKVINPVTSSRGAIANKITLRFVLFDYSDGQKEEWYTVANVRMDSIGALMGWQQVRIPLEWIQSGQWGDLKTGRFNTPNGTKDGVLAFDKIGGFKLEYSCSADAGEPFGADLVYSGKVLYSALIPSGFRETDHTPPALVGNLQATKSTYSNILTWSDVPNEPASTYTAYVSEKPFTKADAAGVENIPPFGVPLGTQLATHLLLYPKVDHDVSLYYGVTATDKAGNTNDPAAIGPITNKAKGVPTIAMATVSSFVANGDLSEWSAITPIVLTGFGANPTATIVTNTKIDNDADCSVKAYLAADNNNLYVAFDVTDDIISIDTTSLASTWLQDSQDLFIGLYDWRGKRHPAYQHGATPDYHLRFSQNKVLIDNAGGATLIAPGTNYSFTINTLTSGYTIEARIPWTAFRAAVPSDSLFSPVEGMRIPIDFEANDNDTPGDRTKREGQLDYSSLANGTSYADVWRWTYTWLGSKPSTVGVDEQPGVANVYELQQNYPNPFNPSTIIRYSLAKSGPVMVRVYDVLGREVATLVNGESQSAGNHQVTFNSGSLRGGASSGVYFYRIESGSFRDVKKMMLVK